MSETRHHWYIVGITTYTPEEGTIIRDIPPVRVKEDEAILVSFDHKTPAVVAIPYDEACFSQ